MPRQASIYLDHSNAIRPVVGWDGTPRSAVSSLSEEEILVLFSLLSKHYLSITDHRPTQVTTPAGELIAELHELLRPETVSRNANEYLYYLQATAARERLTRLEIVRDSLSYELGDDPDHIAQVEGELLAARCRVDSYRLKD